VLAGSLKDGTWRVSLDSQLLRGTAYLKDAAGAAATA
jgi:hypothetical protein